MSQKVDSRDHDSAEALRAPTIDSSGKRRWLYPVRLAGPRASVRRFVAWVLIALYLVMPFIVVDGLPLIRLDVIGQKAYFFGAAFSFQEAGYLAFLLIGAALLLFLMTSLFGRVWCGYGCPQTVFVEWVIRPIEEWIEGPALRRKRRDEMGFSFDKAWRKVLKYVCFILVVSLISNAFLAYFVPPSELLKWVTSSPLDHPGGFAVMVSVSGLLFFDLVWFREQFCSFLCPYARFQSVMIDTYTPTIAYDKNRGEPRGKRSMQGDCIDCQQCVRVCPTGIDIRDGLQLECIQCGRCADACDRIMVNLKRPLGLISMKSEAELKSHKKHKKLRLRPVSYLLAFAVISSIAIVSVVTRDTLDISIVRQRATTYVSMPNGKLANFFEIRVTNRSKHTQSLALASDLEGVEMICSICEQDIKPFAELKGNLIIAVGPNTVANTRIKILPSKDLAQPFTLPMILPGS